MRWVPIFTRELRASLSSPAVCIFGAVHFALLGVLFNRTLGLFSQAGQDPWIHEQLFGGRPLNVNDLLIPEFLGIILTLLIFTVPFLTMRLVAEERRAGTYDLLMSFPLRERDVVIGKFLASWVTVCLLIAFSVLHIGLIWWACEGRMEIAPIVVGYLGLFLVGGAFVALGLFTSSLTENQLVAGLVSFGLLLLAMMIGSLAPENSGFLAALLKGLDTYTHSERLLSGVVQAGDVSHFAVMIFIFLHLADRALVIRRQGVVR